MLVTLAFDLSGTIGSGGPDMASDVCMTHLSWFNPLPILVPERPVQLLGRALLYTVVLLGVLFLKLLSSPSPYPPPVNLHFHSEGLPYQGSSETK